MTSPDGESRATGGAVGREHELSRRELLLAAGALGSGALLAGCGVGSSASSRVVGPHSPAVAALEARRPRTGRIHHYLLTPKPTQIDIGGPVVDTWAYGDAVPGPLIRARPGDELRIQVKNALPAETSVHWHGVAVDNPMDGVPPFTQQPIPRGRGMLYHYVVPDAGTYWYHPHVGLQLDRGLYGPLLIDDPSDRGSYDVEFVVVLDDWIDGINGQTPESVYAKLRAKGSHMGSGSGMGSGMGMGSSGMSSMTPSTSSNGSPLGRAPADVLYPYYLINGRVASAPVTLSARPGQRARIRFINSAAGTAFRVALGEHRMTVTHTDGYPVQPVVVDNLVIGMAERYDVTVTLADGAFPLIALPLGAPGQAMAVVRTAKAPAPKPTDRPAALNGRMLAIDLSDLTATPAVQLPARAPDVIHDVVLSGGMGGGFRWTINGRAYPNYQPLEVHQGQRARLRLRNHSMMFHPIHLHGHTFQVRSGPSGSGPRKDTVNVLPMQTVTIDMQANNPGQWVIHCHNLYHQQAGMMSLLSYRA